MNSILTLTDCEAQPPTQHANCCEDADHRSRIHLNRVWCWLRSPWGYAACQAYWILLCCLKLASGYIGSGPLQRDSSAGLRCCLWCPGAICLELSAVHHLWLLLLGLDACRMGKAVYQTQLLLALDLGGRSAKDSNHLEIRLCLQASC